MRCPALPQTSSDCSHSGTLEVSCVGGHQRFVSQDGCEGHGEEGAPRLAAAHELARQLGVADLLRGPRGPCDTRARVGRGPSVEEIDLTSSARANIYY